MQNEGETDEESFNLQEPLHLASKIGSMQSCNNVCHTQPTEISNDFSRQSVRSLNNKQRLEYNAVLSWCREKVQNFKSLKPQEINPIYFLSLEVLDLEKVI